MGGGDILNSPGRWDFFISHTQGNCDATTIATALFHELEKKGHTVWLDVKMVKKNKDAMREGVVNSQCVIAIITEGPRPENNYFKRPYCLDELRWAREHGVRIQPVVRVQDKNSIGKFLGGAPDDLKDLEEIDFIDINRGDSEHLDVDVNKIVRLLEAKVPEIVTRKLENPGRELSMEESIECLTACVAMGEAEARQAKGRNVVIFIGNTGAGKSTLVNYLAGCKLEMVSRKDAKIETGDPKQKITRVAADSKTRELMRIGHDNKSMTFLPDAHFDENLGMILGDCPGFADNRGAEINIANACNIKQLIAAASSVRVVVLINYDSLKADRGRGLKELIKVLHDLFGGDVDTLVTHAPAMLVGVSKVPKAYLDENEDRVENGLEDVKNMLTDTSGLSEEQAKLVNMLGDHAFVWHPLDKGNPSWTTRPQLIERIRSLEPITAPGAIFKTVLNAEDENLLHAIKDDVEKRVILQLEAATKPPHDYAAATASLKMLFNLKVIENTHVDRLFHAVKERVYAHARAVERAAAAAVMHHCFEDAEGKLAQLEQIATRLGWSMPDGVNLAETVRSTRGSLARAVLFAAVRAVVIDENSDADAIGSGIESLERAIVTASAKGVAEDALEAGRTRLAELEGAKAKAEKKAEDIRVATAAVGDAMRKAANLDENSDASTIGSEIQSLKRVIHNASAVGVANSVLGAAHERVAALGEAKVKAERVREAANELGAVVDEYAFLDARSGVAQIENGIGNLERAITSATSKGVARSDLNAARERVTALRRAKDEAAAAEAAAATKAQVKFDEFKLLLAKAQPAPAPAPAFFGGGGYGGDGGGVCARPIAQQTEPRRAAPVVAPQSAPRPSAATRTPTRTSGDQRVGTTVVSGKTCVVYEGSRGGLKYKNASGRMTYFKEGDRIVHWN